MQTSQRVPEKPPLPKVESSAVVPNDQNVIAADGSKKVTAAMLLRKAFSGDAQARHDLMAIAGDATANEIERSVAIQYLVRAGTPESLVIVAKQLGSEKPDIRATAYFNLPEKYRPLNFDYTASPNEASRAEVEKVIEHILQ